MEKMTQGSLEGTKRTSEAVRFTINIPGEYELYEGKIRRIR